MFGRTMRGAVTTVSTGALLCVLTGCSGHKRVQPQPVILAKQTPVPLETPAAVSNPPLIDAPKQAKLPAVPVAEAATKPKRIRRRPKQTAAAVPPPPAPALAAQAAGAGTGTTSAAGAPAAPAPVQVAGNVAPAGPAPTAADTVIGALTPGGADQTPQARQDAQELLVSTDRRLKSLPAQTQQNRKVQISQIRNFWTQASDALRAGDAEGAKTLALKAKLLLDDLEVAGQ